MLSTVKYSTSENIFRFLDQTDGQLFLYNIRIQVFKRTTSAGNKCLI